MKLLKKLGLVALGSLSLASSMLPAFAADIFRDSTGNVYVQGTAATTLTGIGRITTNDPLTRSVRAGFCGELVLNTNTAIPVIGDAWKVGTTNVSRPSATITSRDLLPSCRNGVFAPAASNSFVDATTPGRDRVVLTGFMPGQSYQVEYTGIDSSRSARPNNCGFFRFSNTITNPIASELTINGAAVTVASLPIDNPPLCQRQSSGSYVRYIPAP